MNLERVVMLLNIIHMTAGEPRFKILHAKANDELAKMQEESMEEYQLPDESTNESTDALRRV